MKLHRGHLVVAVATCLVTGTSGRAHAAGEDLENCLWANGTPIEQPICKHLRKLQRQKQAEEEAQRKRQEQLDEQERQLRLEREDRDAEYNVKTLIKHVGEDFFTYRGIEDPDERRAVRAEEIEKAQKRAEEIRAERERQSRAESEARQQRMQAEAAAAERKRQAKIEAMKKKCGDAYSQPPEIGMSFKRLRECTPGEFTLERQINTAEGVQSFWVHESGRARVIVIDGKVVEWLHL